MIKEIDLSSSADVARSCFDGCENELKKELSPFFKETRNRSKQDKCYVCGKKVSSFCNSHTIPKFCLKNISCNGNLYSINSIVDNFLEKGYKGVREASVFNLICHDCDRELFREYENPDSYKYEISQKMLAQIEAKNYLKNISKKLFEIEFYKILNKKMISGFSFNRMLNVSLKDLKFYEKNVLIATKNINKKFLDQYHVGFVTVLPYIVPVAFQGLVALSVDLNGEQINNFYNENDRYYINYFSMCILPLEDKTIVLAAYDKKNKRYKNFFRQLSSLFDLYDKLSVINFILFLYCEDYFLSPKISDKDLLSLRSIAGMTTGIISSERISSCELMENTRKKFDLKNRACIPNLLHVDFSM